VVIFVVIGFKYIRPENLKPLIPKNTGSFGSFGWSGIIRAAAVVFFAYIGFDAVSTAAQETKNPKRAMPIGILGSLAICTVLYIFFAYVMTGVANYKMFNVGGSADLAPVAIAIKQMGPVGVDGLVTPAYPWLNTMIIIAILLGYSSVILVMLLGQSRVFYSMSTDGLLPKVFSQIHPKRRTPYKSNLLFMLFVSAFAAFVPGRIVGEMTSIGTLFAFILVCIGVMVMRNTMKDAPRAFRVPWVPLIPILGVLVCLGMMVFLPFDTWIRLIVWMLIGLDVYAGYGMQKSHLNDGSFDPKAHKIVGICGIALGVLLVGLAMAHHYTSEVPDLPLYYFSLAFAIIHLIVFAVKLSRKENTVS
jgi:APA family basic amino acid/polyamine antiporter